MRYYAETLGYGDEVDFWGLCGLLHDVDFEQYPDEHCVKVRELLEAQEAVNELMNAVNNTITFAITGEMPSNCTHDCSTCGGCH